jgi:hypothetical protein
VPDFVRYGFYSSNCPKTHVCGQLRQTRCSSDALPPGFPQRRFLAREGHLAEYDLSGVDATLYGLDEPISKGLLQISFWD